MIGVLVVLAGWFGWAWLPVDRQSRARSHIGLPPDAPDDRVIQWWERRKARAPGQQRTSVLLQSLVGELLAGSIPGRALVQVMGPRYETPAALIATPPTADAGVWRDVASIWLAADELGFSMADALARVQHHARVDQEVAREVEATAAGPKFSLFTIMAMPVLTVPLGNSIGAHPVHFILHNPVGWACAAIAIAMDITAFLWMRRLAKRAMA